MAEQKQQIGAVDKRSIRDLLRRIEAARRFPDNTDPCVRHVQIMGETLGAGRPYPMLDEERGHCATSLLAVVAALYEARNALADSTQGKAASVLEAEQQPEPWWKDPRNYGAAEFASPAPEAGGHAAAPTVDELMELARQYAHAYFNHHTGSRDGMLAKTQARLRAALSTPSPTAQQSSVHPAAPQTSRTSGSGWWCANHRAYVPSEHVTSDETHAPLFGGCGGKVVGMPKPTPEQMMAGYEVACRFGVLEARAFELAEQMWQAQASAAGMAGPPPRASCRRVNMLGDCKCKERCERAAADPMAQQPNTDSASGSPARQGAETDGQEQQPSSSHQAAPGGSVHRDSKTGDPVSCSSGHDGTGRTSVEGGVNAPQVGGSARTAGVPPPHEAQGEKQ